MGAKKKTESFVFMSQHIQSNLLSLEIPVDATLKHRLWILCHGTYASAFVGQAVLAGMYACTVTGKPTVYEFFSSSGVYAMLSIAGSYQIFWLRNRRSLATLYERLLNLAKQLEANIDKREIEISRSLLRAMTILTRGIAFTFVFESISVNGQPILDARLPYFLKGMGAFTIGMLSLQAMHMVVMSPIAISSALYLNVQTRFVFYLTIGYKLIGRRLRNCSARNYNELRDILKLHSEWMSLSVEGEKLFSVWNTVFVVHMLLISLVGTVGIVSGVLAFEISMLPPFVGSYVWVMCRLGELLKQESTLVADCIYQGHWLEADAMGRKLTLLPIMRANRPANMKATLIGPLTLEKFLNLLKQWYRFLQFMLKAKI